MKWILISELVIRLLELQQNKEEGDKLDLDEVAELAESVGIKGKDVEEFKLALPKISELSGRIEKLFKK